MASRKLAYQGVCAIAIVTGKPETINPNCPWQTWTEDEIARENEYTAAVGLALSAALILGLNRGAQNMMPQA